jgi:hypothetical protein
MCTSSERALRCNKGSSWYCWQTLASLSGIASACNGGEAAAAAPRPRPRQVLMVKDISPVPTCETAIEMKASRALDEISHVRSLCTGVVGLVREETKECSSRRARNEQTVHDFMEFVQTWWAWCSTLRPLHANVIGYSCYLAPQFCHFTLLFCLYM